MAICRVVVIVVVLYGIVSHGVQCVGLEVEYQMLFNGAYRRQGV